MMEEHTRNMFLQYRRKMKLKVNQRTINFQRNRLSRPPVYIYKMKWGKFSHHQCLLRQFWVLHTCILRNCQLSLRRNNNFRFPDIKKFTMTRHVTLDCELTKKKRGETWIWVPPPTLSLRTTKKQKTPEQVEFMSRFREIIKFRDPDIIDKYLRRWRFRFYNRYQVTNVEANVYHHTQHHASFLLLLGLIPTWSNFTIRLNFNRNVN